jgi:Gnt-I system high-affinity gluconate transporter
MIHPFLAFLLAALVAGLCLGVPPATLVASIQHGIGDTLGALVPIIALGAMLGKLVAESGAAERIATALMALFSPRYVQWALAATGLVLGIPLFYGVGFVLLVPLLFSVSYRYRLPAVYTGLPMLAALSVTHGFLPPHPSPMALVTQFKADTGRTLLYGLVVAIPAILAAGPLWSLTTKRMVSEPLAAFRPAERAGHLPGLAVSCTAALLPVALLLGITVLQWVRPHWPLALAGDPGTVMLVSLLVATVLLGVGLRASTRLYTSAVRDVASILLIIAGAGALTQVMADSGISGHIAAVLQTLPVSPLVLGWLTAALVRACVGSATVAGLTAAGLLVPLAARTHVDPNLMVLSIGAGSLMFSHVNDAGFWMFKEYFNLGMKDTFRSWSLMETIVGLVGLAGVLVLANWL